MAGLDSVYLVNSGAEAIEGAIKLARRSTGRKKIFSFKDAYHGSTTGALSLMSSDYFTSPFKPLLPELYHLDSYDHSAIEQIDTDTAAVFIEIIRAEVGAIPVEKEVLQAIQARCKAVGALLVVDEIQTGFGRTGAILASSAVDIQPDILVLAKGMGGGLPIGAFMASSKLMHMLTDEPVLGHITTFGGNPVCCAASIATFDVIKELDTEQSVPEKEAFIRKKLIHPALKEINGKGLLLALDFGEEALAQRIIRTCITNGVLTDWFLFAPHKLRMAPPLNITEEELGTACDIILRSIDEALELNHGNGN
jgi:acetylornithine/succinyldiaminopimelate/putrescine aminotransferase